MKRSALTHCLLNADLSTLKLLMCHIPKESLQRSFEENSALHLALARCGFPDQTEDVLGCLSTIVDAQQEEGLS
jgi:hypothetical protein